MWGAMGDQGCFCHPLWISTLSPCVAVCYLQIISRTLSFLFLSHVVEERCQCDTCLPVCSAGLVEDETLLAPASIPRFLGDTSAVKMEGGLC